jgi:hypothetical protein
MDNNLTYYEIKNKLPEETFVGLARPMNARYYLSLIAGDMALEKIGNDAFSVENTERGRKFLNDLTLENIVNHLNETIPEMRKNSKSYYDPHRFEYRTKIKQMLNLFREYC